MTLQRTALVGATLAGLPGVRVLSLDCFDTLVVRVVPNDVVVPAKARALADRLGCRLDDASVLAHRTAFARAAASSGRASGEWTVSAWLVALAADHGLDKRLVVDAGLEAELEVERRLTRTDPEAHTLVALARARGLRVCVASDTWLDEPLLAALLAHHGIAADLVVSSGTAGASKRAGTLFAPLARTLGVAPDQILHVGDNWKADQVRAAAAGLHVCGWRARVEDAPTLVRRHAPSLATALTVDGRVATTPLERAGACLLAPLAVCATVWARAQAVAAGAEAMVYLARDTWPLWVAARRLDAILPPAPPRVYVRLSRRAVSLAHPDRLLQTGAGLAGKFGKATIGELLSAFALNPELHQALLSTAGLQPADRLTRATRRRWVEACTVHRAALDRAVLEQRALIRDHLAQELGGAVPAHVALVDSGWAGTTQDCIAASLRPEVTLTGLYLGVGLGGRASTPQSTKAGLLWDRHGGIDPLNPLERSAGVVRIWDLVLREGAASVARLERLADGRVEPVRASPPPDDDLRVAAELERGLEMGLAALADPLALALKAINPADPVWAAAARAFACTLTVHPDRATAAALLAPGYDEGATAGARVTLGLGGIWRGLVWWPGVLRGLG